MEWTPHLGGSVCGGAHRGRLQSRMTAEDIGAFDGGSPMSHVEFKFQQCSFSILFFAISLSI